MHYIYVNKYFSYSDIEQLKLKITLLTDFFGISDYYYFRKVDCSIFICSIFHFAIKIIIKNKYNIIYNILIKKHRF